MDRIIRTATLADLDAVAAVEAAFPCLATGAVAGLSFVGSFRFRFSGWASL